MGAFDQGKEFPMNRDIYADTDYGHPTVPPATPPVIDSGADADDAADLAMTNGDSDAPGSQPAHFNRSREDEVLFDGAGTNAATAGGGDRDYPGQQPDEIVPDQGDTHAPDQTPDEVAPDQGDFDRPGNAPIEMPPQPGTLPGETPPPD